MLAGSIGAVASSPFNYCRNRKYYHPADEQVPTNMELFRRLHRNARASGRPFQYVAQRFRIGWGTARVACGMAVTALLYDAMKFAQLVDET